MRAINSPVERLLNQNNQYLVPEYQRRYTWREPHWRSLWTAVVQQIPRIVADETPKEDDKKQVALTHFLGSIVLRPHGTTPGATDVGKHDVIDGQQRLTTMSVLLAALRDSAETDRDRSKINDQLLVNRYEEGDLYYKLLPGPSDRADYFAVIQGDGGGATGLIGSAYRWFKREIATELSKETSVSLPRLETSVRKRLEIVDVTIEKEDNAHRVFQTLNSTGEALSAVDLLRNHFFMLLPNAAKHAYAALWQPMEALLGDKIGPFLLDELVARGGPLVNTSQRQVYTRWQEILGAMEHNENAVLGALEELTARASCYGMILSPSLATPLASSRLKRLQNLGGRAHNPLVLQALWLQRRGLIGDVDVADSIALIESYLVRRLLIGKPTNNLNRMLSTAAGQTTLDENFVASLHGALSAASFDWPSDETLRAAAASSIFYKKPSQTRRYILERLEDAVSGKEKVDWSVGNYQLEHIMPQTATEEWLKALSNTGEARPPEAHRELIHTLGNITLTAYNPELSNHPLERKQEIYRDSKLHLNQALKSEAQWGRAQIHARGQYLIGVAIEEWTGPLASADSLAEAPIHLLELLLAQVTGSGWTTVDALAIAADRTPEEVERALDAARFAGAERVAGDDGQLRVDWAWVSEPAIVAELVELALEQGVIESLDEAQATSANMLTGAELVDAVADE